MRPAILLGLVRLLMLCWLAAAAAGSELRIRCLPDSPHWQAIASGAQIRILETDLARQRVCDIHLRLAPGAAPRWLSLGALAQTSVRSLPPASGQAAAALVWRSSRSAALAPNAQGEVLAHLQVHLPISSHIGVRLEAPADFLARDARDTQIRTALLALLFAIGLAGGLFAWAMHDSAIGWYTGFTLAVALVWALLTGHAISPTALAIDYPQFSQRLLLASYGLALFCGLRFSLSYCNLARLAPRLQRLLRQVGWLILAFTALGFLPALYQDAINYFNLLAIVALLSMFLPGLYSLGSGEWRSAGFYLAGWVPLILSWVGLMLLYIPGMPGYPAWLGSLATQLQGAGLLPGWLASPHSRQIALLFQAAIFALALADRTARLRRRIERHALTDKSTRLPNRTSFLLRGDLLLAKAKQENRSLVLFDIADFATINETLGYDCGDQVLFEVGQRLGRKLGHDALLARVGGKQFAALLNDSLGEGALNTLATSLSRQTFTVDEQPLDIRLRCAAANYPVDGAHIEVLIRQAEIALQAAKLEKLPAMLYHSGLDRDQRFQLSLLSALRTAMEHQQLQLFLQPKAHCRTGRVSGAEVLLRWQHPVHGLVSPRDFLPFAEKTGLIVELTRWMLLEALQLAKQWQRQGLDLRLSLNLSAADLADPNLPAHMAEYLMHSRADPTALTLEITESEVMRDPKLAVSSMQALRTLGFALALDDFGTGNSALAYLQDMPVSEIKIDRSFVANASRAEHGRVLIEAIVALSHTLGLHTVAEGVEDAAEWQMVLAAGCDEIQGYLLAPPMPVADFKAWLGRNQPFILPVVQTSSA